MSIILGLDEHGKPCAGNVGSCRLLLLKHFRDVLKDSFKGKRFTWRISANEPVPENSLRLWRKHGYEPSSIGTAYIMFAGSTKEHLFPLGERQAEKA